MVWDKNAASGSLKVNQFDDAVRTNSDALETALDAEHDFTTGGTQTGQHHFSRDTNATQTTAASSSVDGRLLFTTDDRSGERVPYVVESGALVAVTPAAPVPRTDEVQDWTAGQYGSVVDVTPGAGTPKTFDWDLADGNFFRATIDANTIINNPADALGTDEMGQFTIQLTMDGAGGHTITFDTKLLPAFGAQPAVNSGSSEITLIHVTRLAESGKNFSYVVQTIN